jgi:putative ABC transport system permease protein
MPTFRLALQSLWNRRVAAALTICAIAISVALVLSVQRLRTGARESFSNTISGTDLIVGARTGPLNLLLYSVFHLDEVTTEVSWESYRKIAKHPDVAWTIPLSLGDAHRGYRVLGTSEAYFRYFRFGSSRPLTFSTGAVFHDLYDAVLGADVASNLHYQLGSVIILSHGLGEVSFTQHKDKPFRAVGILAKTGTPVDRTVHVSLQAITAIHDGWETGRRSTEAPPSASTREQDLTPMRITAFLVGMRSRVMAFTMQRAINEYDREALLAIMPGVALDQLWQLVGVADTALMIVAAFVVIAGLLGMLTAILTSLNERRREMAILRSVGARPAHVFGLLMFEAGILAATGAVAGTALMYLGLLAARPLLEQRYGVFIPAQPLSETEALILGVVIVAALLTGSFPAWRAYRNSVSDGLLVRA